MTFSLENRKHGKLLLGLGAIAAITAPLVVIVACSNDNSSELGKAKS